jgi:hypothetical protein
MEPIAGKKARSKRRLPIPFLTLDDALRSSLVALQVGVILTVLLQVLGS